MPSVLSKISDKILSREWSFPYNCYEVGHGWTPYCTHAAYDVGVAAFKNSLPLYTSLYLFTQLGLQRKYDLDSFCETFKSITTSSAFLAFNFFAGIGVSCLVRNNSDRYYFRTQCLLPGFVASYMALMIERPSRRPALAFYMANLSSELLFKYFLSQSNLKPMPHGETVLFVLGMACWLRFVKINGFGHDPVSSALKYLIGSNEAKSRARLRRRNDDRNLKGIEAEQVKALDKQVEQNSQPKRKSKLENLDNKINEFFSALVGKHECCPHEGVSCLHYAITPTFTRFLMGYVGRSMLAFGSKPQLLLKEPRKQFVSAFANSSSIKFGLFLGTFVGSTKAIHCILRWLTGQRSDWHSAAAGGVSGLSMLFAPRSTLSTYIIWKCLEQYFFKAVENGKIKRPNEIIALTYALSVNVLLFIFAIEPRFIRPSYMKFIDKISDHKLHQVNRIVLDVFGSGASIGYEDWFPNLDPKFMSREFHELIFNWLIQPH